MPAPFAPFKREDHIYENPAFAEFLKDAVRAFNGSPVVQMPPPSFTGSGVYALYCTTTKGPYSKFGKEINRLEYKVPIYVGKAVPAGWRQSRQVGDAEDSSMSLCSRLNEHARSIEQGKGLSLSDFACRFLPMSIPEMVSSTHIVAFMISWYKPLWNTVIRGFDCFRFMNKEGVGRSSGWAVLHGDFACYSTTKTAGLLRKIDHHLTQTALSFVA